MKKSKIKDISIPFNKKGDQLSFTPNWGKDMLDLRINIPFNATLFLNNYKRGNSSVKMEFINEYGNKYEMFISDFTKLALKHDTSKGITGEWAFVKKGQNFGLVLLED